MTHSDAWCDDWQHFIMHIQHLSVITLLYAHYNFRCLMGYSLLLFALLWRLAPGHQFAAVDHADTSSEQPSK